MFSFIPSFNGSDLPEKPSLKTDKLFQQILPGRFVVLLLRLPREKLKWETRDFMSLCCCLRLRGLRWMLCLQTFLFRLVNGDIIFLLISCSQLHLRLDWHAFESRRKTSLFGLMFYGFQINNLQVFSWRLNITIASARQTQMQSDDIFSFLLNDEANVICGLSRWSLIAESKPHIGRITTFGVVLASMSNLAAYKDVLSHGV